MAGERRPVAYAFGLYRHDAASDAGTSRNGPVGPCRGGRDRRRGALVQRLQLVEADHDPAKGQDRARDRAGPARPRARGAPELLRRGPWRHARREGEVRSQRLPARATSEGAVRLRRRRRRYTRTRCAAALRLPVIPAASPATPDDATANSFCFLSRPCLAAQLGGVAPHETGPTLKIWCLAQSAPAFQAHTAP